MVAIETLKDQVMKAVSAYQDEILEFTEALVRIPTENPPGRSYLRCVEAIAGKLEEMGLAAQIVEVPGAAAGGGEVGPRYCLLSTYGQGKRTLYFHGHYDVVPAASQDQTHIPSAVGYQVCKHI